MKTILISTGGSGGHVNPALSLFDHLKNNFKTFLVTDLRGLKFIDKKKYTLKVFDAPRIPKNLLLFPSFILLLFISIIKAFFFLKKNNINHLISTGGYMSTPLCIAAKILGINIFLFEPNMFLGRSNNFFLKSAKKIICYSDKIINYPLKYKNKIFEIKPILKKSLYLDENVKNKFNKNEINLLILGGSQGTKFFDNFCEKVVLSISKNMRVSLVQQIFNIDEVKRLKILYNSHNIKNYLFNFDPDISKKIKNCNFAITRCGASTMAELIYLKIPFIGIPYPHAKDNHQFFNLKHYEDKNCCWGINQYEAKVESIANQIQNIFNETSDYKEKIDNMYKISYDNSWNNINKKLINLLNEY